MAKFGNESVYGYSTTVLLCRASLIPTILMSVTALLGAFEGFNPCGWRIGTVSTKKYRSASRAS